MLREIFLHPLLQCGMEKINCKNFWCVLPVLCSLRKSRCVLAFSFLFFLHNTEHTMYAPLFFALALNKISWKSFYVNSQNSSPSFLCLLSNPCGYTLYYILFIRSPRLGHLGSFQYSAVVNTGATVDLGHWYFYLMAGMSSG